MTYAIKLKTMETEIHVTDISHFDYDEDWGTLEFEDDDLETVFMCDKDIFEYARRVDGTI